MVANGIIISKVCYLIQLWRGGCAFKLVQNRTARAVTGCSWFNPSRRLLSACNQLSMKPLVEYQSLIMTHKILLTSAPHYLCSEFSRDFPYKTRLATTEGIRGMPAPQNQHIFSDPSFCYRATRSYNEIPLSIRSSKSINIFRVRVRVIVKNIGGEKCASWVMMIQFLSNQLQYLFKSTMFLNT